MGTTELIILYGDPSTGKTTAFFPDEEAGIIGLPPEKLFVVNCAGPGKKFPVPDNWVEAFRHNKNVSDPKSHMYTAPTLTHARAALEGVLKGRQDINHILVDDVGIGSAKRVTGSEAKLEFDDWRKIGVELQNLINTAMIQTDRTVFVYLVFHSQGVGQDQTRTKVRTPGKLVDDYMGGVEGQVSTVLQSMTSPKLEDPDEANYFLRTRAINGTARSLRGMFPPTLPNDMAKVVEMYCKHQKIQIP